MRGSSPSGETLSVNNKYFEKDGQPWFPVMGEFHYSRYPQEYWEEELVKMKSGGISIVATYVFWNAHENPKGSWNWHGDNDLRKFIELCKKHGLYVWLRIGPWCHGEQLHGGFPEWIQHMKGRRSNDPGYLQEVEQLYYQIGVQTNQLYFKDGGPVIGVQLENEYASGDSTHIAVLKKVAVAADIHPVFFSITANTVFQRNSFEAIPLEGAYPYRGWEKSGGGPTKDFLYGDDQWILTDALGGKLYYDLDKYPKALCEQGCGSQMTYKNRFIVDPHVVEAHLQNQIGRGVNFIGYYMFQGGVQQPGLKEPGLPESYDFQAPLSEFGLPRTSYSYLKILHHFINDFGTDIAAMQETPSPHPVRNERDTSSLRYTSRIKDSSGFIFLCNTQSRVTMPDKQVALHITLAHEQIDFPSFTLKGQTAPVLPFNLSMNGVLLKYATAQPFARINNGNNQAVFFLSLETVPAEFALDAATENSIESNGWRTSTANNRIVLSGGKSNSIVVNEINGKTATIVILTRKQAEHAWRANINNKEILVISDADVLFTNNTIELRQRGNPSLSFEIYPANALDISMNGKQLRPVRDGIFSRFGYSVKRQIPKISVEKKSPGEYLIKMDNAQPPGICDVFVDMDYYGGSAVAKIKNRVVTDHLYNGTHWLLGLKRYAGKGGLHLQVQPWDDTITGVVEHLVDGIKKHATEFKTLEVIPEYKATFNAD
ncbi:MAG: beta-galactosidase [Puia sp.]